MTKLQEASIYIAILLFGCYGVLSVAERALARQDRIQQEAYFSE